mmetsp:Transcript_22228/g.52928  ORF Transcript_22228/g.52928 Transcript_22228/m.52928 type:complete len:121 (+) Transcript_22228:1001-1363(+)
MHQNGSLWSTSNRTITRPEARRSQTRGALDCTYLSRVCWKCVYAVAEADEGGTSYCTAWRSSVLPNKAHSARFAQSDGGLPKGNPHEVSLFHYSVQNAAGAKIPPADCASHALPPFFKSV